MTWFFILCIDPYTAVFSHKMQNITQPGMYGDTLQVRREATSVPL